MVILKVTRMKRCVSVKWKRKEYPVSQSGATSSIDVDVVDVLVICDDVMFIIMTMLLSSKLNVFLKNILCAGIKNRNNLLIYFSLKF